MNVLIYQQQQQATFEPDVCYDHIFSIFIKTRQVSFDIDYSLIHIIGRAAAADFDEIGWSHVYYIFLSL